jgi:hypothetical protein
MTFLYYLGDDVGQAGWMGEDAEWALFLIALLVDGWCR